MAVVRRLRPDDAEAFRALRLEAVQRHPDAFGSDCLEETTEGVAAFARRLADGCVFGGFVDGQLDAMAGLTVHSGVTPRPMGLVWGVYAREARRGGPLASMVLLAALAHAWTQADRVLLAVTPSNDRAIRFYRRLGFEAYAMAARSLRVGQDHVDQLLMIRLPSWAKNGS